MLSAGLVVAIEGGTCVVLMEERLLARTHREQRENRKHDECFFTSGSGALRCSALVVECLMFHGVGDGSRWSRD